MSLKETKPQIDSIPRIERKDKLEDLGPDSDNRRQKKIKEEVETSRRSHKKRKESPKSDESQNPLNGQSEELGPLLKRIKKEDNCLLIDSKQLIKQGLGTELDLNTRQTIAKPSSKLSEDTTIQTPESSNYSQNSTSGHSAADDLKLSPKQLNLCPKSDPEFNQITSKTKKKKKSKKNEKNEIKAIKTVKNKTKKKAKAIVDPFPKYYSNVFKELKIIAVNDVTADEYQKLIAFKDEGVVRKNCKDYLRFKCLFCSQQPGRQYSTQQFSDWKSAEDHIKSGYHLANKSDQTFSGIDSELALDLCQSTDIEIILRRRWLLSKMSNKIKKQLHSNGIRLKDGFGSNAFVCVDCHNQSFQSLEDVVNHISTSHIKTEPEQVSLKKLFRQLSLEQQQKLFDDEGIITLTTQNSGTKKPIYWCCLCRAYRMTDQKMFKHINYSDHLKARAVETIKKLTAK